MSARQRVKTHLEQFFGPAMYDSSARTANASVPFQIATFSDQPAENALTFVTLGISEFPLGAPPVRQEFLLSAWKPDVTDALYEALFGIGHELLRLKTAADYGEILELPKPVVENGPSQLLVYAPTYFDPGLEVVQGQPPVLLTWLIPLTRAETELVLNEGLRALELRFEEADPDLLDLERESVV